VGRSSKDGTCKGLVVARRAGIAAVHGAVVVEHVVARTGERRRCAGQGGNRNTGDQSDRDDERSHVSTPVVRAEVFGLGRVDVGDERDMGEVFAAYH
jgi:hypothetical protein